MARWQERLTFGDRVPWAIGLVLTSITLASLSAAFISRHGASLFDLGALTPALVWRGQAWRLFTWPLLQSGPIAFIIECLMIYWFGRDLAEEWGSGELLKIFCGIILVTGVITCLVARVDAPIMTAGYLGSLALTTAMIVAWGLTFPHRIVRIYFVLPVTGFWIAWLTVGVSVVFAMYSGWERYLPELIAEALILGHLYGEPIRARFRQRTKTAAANERTERARKRAKSVAYLRLVDAREDELPELPPDVARKLNVRPPRGSDE